MATLVGQTVSHALPLVRTGQQRHSLAGTTCLITGASSGIGKDTAHGLARLGASVVMLCRDRTRGELARAEIVRTTGNHSIDLVIADLSLQSSVRQVAAAVRDSYGTLSVLVNNAGVLRADRTVTADGFELTFAVNHLAPFLLTHLLLDLLTTAAPARIINLGSASHSNVLDFDNLQAERFYRPMRAYGQSKLANILFTYELARRLSGSRVTANCVDPGLVRTGIIRDLRGPFRTLIDVTAPFYRSPVRGAETVIHLASSPDLERVTGKYFKDKREIRSARVSYDLEVARRLWSRSEQMTGLAGVKTPVSISLAGTDCHRFNNSIRGHTP